MINGNQLQLPFVNQSSCWELPLGDPTERLRIGHYRWELEAKRGEVIGSGSDSRLSGQKMQDLEPKRPEAESVLHPRSFGTWCKSQTD